MSKLKSLFLSMLLPALVMAQDVEMAEGMRSSGKIFVVVGVIAIVVLGLFAYLIYLDRKVSRIERTKE